ncbi:hypothetical protein G4228_006949 [Cervus hanglu yarkandensis]|nr:hypothetical protein G4228_006949 [Cervus hanglu yarkandensis]
MKRKPERCHQPLNCPACPCGRGTGSLLGTTEALATQVTVLQQQASSRGDIGLGATCSPFCPGLGLSSSQPSCAPQLPAEAKRAQEHHGARQKALETCVVQQMLVDPVGAPGTPRAAFGAAPSDVALLPLHTVTEFSHWMEDQARLEKQLQKLKAQAELERERAQLLVRATMAEEQLSELQEYVDQHLGRYKQEILRLRKLVGTGEPWKVGAIPSDKPQHPRTCSH